MAVEVKGPGDTLSEHQKIMHSFLEKIHLPVNVIHTDQIIRGKYKTFGKKLLALRLQYQLPIGRHIHELDFGPSL